MPLLSGEYQETVLENHFTPESLSRRISELGFEAVRRAATESPSGLYPLIYREILDQQAAAEALVRSITQDGGVITHEVELTIREITGINEANLSRVIGILSQNKVIAYVGSGYAKSKTREGIIAELDLVA